MITTTTKNRKSVDAYYDELIQALKNSDSSPEDIKNILLAYHQDHPVQTSSRLTLKDFLRQPSPTPPLVVAAFYVRPDLFHPLIEAGADPNQIAEESDDIYLWSGETTFDLLIKNGAQKSNAFHLCLEAVNHNPVFGFEQNRLRALASTIRSFEI